MIVDCHTHVGEPAHFSKQFIAGHRSSRYHFVSRNHAIRRNSTQIGYKDSQPLRSLREPRVSKDRGREISTETTWFEAAHSRLLTMGGLVPQ